MDCKPLSFAVTRYDGASATGASARAELGPGGMLVLFQNDSQIASYSAHQLRWDPPVGKAPIIIKLSDGSQIEAPFDATVVQALTRLLPSTFTTIRKLETNLRWALGCMATATACAVILYIYGIPAIAAIVQPFVPYSWKQIVGRQIVTFMDSHILEPSQLSDERQIAVAQIAKELAAHTELGHVPDVILRRFPSLSKMPTYDGDDDIDTAYAFAALPNTVVVTDALANVLTVPEIEGVIAHELGHLAYDHGTQRLIKTSLVSAATVFLFGSDPGIIQGLALSVIDAQYSQAQESAADSYAVSLLLKAGKDPACLAHALEKLTAKSKESTLAKYTSSHPATAQRVASILQSAQQK